MWPGEGKGSGVFVLDETGGTWQSLVMPRRLRVASGGYGYHVLNRAVGRMRIFGKQRDFEAFENNKGVGSHKLGPSRTKTPDPFIRSWNSPAATYRHWSAAAGATVVGSKVAGCVVAHK